MASASAVRASKVCPNCCCAIAITRYASALFHVLFHGDFPLTTASGGGKAVTVITYAYRYPLGLKRYFYATADTLFDIRRADVDPATQILTALP